VTAEGQRASFPFSGESAKTKPWRLFLQLMGGRYRGYGIGLSGCDIFLINPDI
jgi:hypothetical protein